MSSLNEGILYLDASALLRLVVRTPETDALREELLRWPERVSSRLSCVETLQLARRSAPGLSDAAVERSVRDVLSRVALVEIDREAVEAAAGIDSPGLGVAEALHVGAALSLGEDLGALASYSGVVLLAADAAGILVLAPGAAPEPAP